MNVLVVTKSNSFSRLITRSLDFKGDIWIVSSRSKALEYFSNLDFSAIICDLDRSLPYRTIRILQKARKKDRLLPIVAVSRKDHGIPMVDFLDSSNILFVKKEDIEKGFYNTLTTAHWNIISDSSSDDIRVPA